MELGGGITTVGEPGPAYVLDRGDLARHADGGERRRRGAFRSPSRSRFLKANAFTYLLPVVAHLNGANGSKWRTDVQIYNSNVGEGPVNTNSS